jgi:hypothetical protein
MNIPNFIVNLHLKTMQMQLGRHYVYTYSMKWRTKILLLSWVTRRGAICGAGTAYLDFGGVCVPHLSFSVFIHPVIYVVGTKQ